MREDKKREQTCPSDLIGARWADIMGNILVVTIPAASIHNTVAGRAAFRKSLEKYPNIWRICAAVGYRKTLETVVAKLGRTVDISDRVKPNGWQIHQKCWRVERIFR